MSAAQNTRQDWLGRVLVDAPQLFETIAETMAIQPKIDPSAAFGPLQIPMHIQEHGLSIADCEAISKSVRGRAIRFYLIIRALSHNLFPKEVMLDRAYRSQSFSRAWIIEEIKKRDPKFYSGEQL